MGFFAWLVLGAYFALMIGVGYWARKKVRNASDFFTAGGSMPWWLSGISHHMSGYSSAVFVGYAALAYTLGISVYFWWALSIALSLLLGMGIFPARWARMRQRFNVISPLEYLKIRYNLPTQQLLGWSGAFLKVFDVGAKWSASAILLHVFAGVPFLWGVLLTGGVTVIYSVMGGLWADALTDLSQFIIQLVAGISMLVAVLIRLGGVSSLWHMWKLLPPDHLKPFHGEYSALFAATYFFVNMLSYNGGSWSLAQRFLASPTSADARRSAALSAVLYLLWPPILFFPMWAAPLIFPHLQDPSESYALLTQTLLPSGLIGLVLAGLFAHTMAMTSSDANAVSAVIVRDIIPVLRGQRAKLKDSPQLLLGRIVTFLFLLFSMVLALFASHLGGVIGIVILWYGALSGPIAIPILLGLLFPFRRSGPAAAIGCWLVGAITFGALKIFPPQNWLTLSSQYTNTFTVGAPMLTALVTYIALGFIIPSTNEDSDALLMAFDSDVEETVLPLR
ncbi:sodium:solute symporter family protein [Edaphobacter albus]|uniref:sodium:solute symporter family protein n=1 Tax=Edaphobacter sp. 4G125 TaxID=2763071 RepID=UPI0016480267|nr:sodium:solute symporter family protein [Edaphobacter sp. 4G125]QNI37360.1 Na+:solute symporter [Edaphobacter sp. 4G125]